MNCFFFIIFLYIVVHFCHYCLYRPTFFSHTLIHGALFLCSSSFCIEPLHDSVLFSIVLSFRCFFFFYCYYGCWRRCLVSSLSLYHFNHLYDTVFSQRSKSHRSVLVRFLQHAIYFGGMHTIWVTYMHEMCKNYIKEADRIRYTYNQQVCLHGVFVLFVNTPNDVVSSSIFFLSLSLFILLHLSLFV